MAADILVAYASWHGATKEIAEHIGDVLRKEGLQADVLPAGSVRDLSPYRAVILGSAIYIGKWRPEAVKFMQANEQTLAQRPVWLFSSGPTGGGDPVQVLNGWRLPTDVQPVADRIHPRDTAVFHGFINLARLDIVTKLALKAMKIQSGDHRQWDVIADWTTKVAATLKSTVAA